MNLNKFKSNGPMLFLILLVATLSLISMKPKDVQPQDLIDYSSLELEVANENPFLCDLNLDGTEEVYYSACGNWHLYDTQNCNCTKPQWNSWFNKNKYRRWCSSPTGGWGAWQYSPWVCNEWCKYK